MKASKVGRGFFLVTGVCVLLGLESWAFAQSHSDSTPHIIDAERRVRDVRCDGQGMPIEAGNPATPTQNSTGSAKRPASSQSSSQSSRKNIDGQAAEPGLSGFRPASNLVAIVSSQPYSYALMLIGLIGLGGLGWWSRRQNPMPRRLWR